MDDLTTVSVNVTGHPDLEALVAEVSRGHVCKLTRDGETVATVSAPRRRREPIDALGRPPGWKPSEEDIAAALSVAGAWKDVDTDKMIADIYRGRDEAPIKPAYQL